MSICVLGLDAADYALAQQWNCENMLLTSAQELETDSCSIDVPATLEVWPSIATGLHPKDHGVLLETADRSTNTAAWRALVRAMNLLPKSVQDKLRRIKTEMHGSSLPTTEASHVFEHGTVSNWPGITACHDWQRGLEWFNAVKDGEISEDEYYQREIGNAGKGFGWLASQNQAGVPIAGVHVHILDSAGHIYAKRPDHLRDIYRAVDELVGGLRRLVDNLVIVSDHGMQTIATEDDDPGVHSTRAFVATSDRDDTLPQSIYDVRDWVTEKLPDQTNEFAGTTAVDAPEQHLKDLGYLD